MNKGNYGKTHIVYLHRETWDYRKGKNLELYEKNKCGGQKINGQSLYYSIPHMKLYKIDK